MKHDWILDEDGEIDVWQLSTGYHNGPRCYRCGEAFCEHCYPEIFTEDCQGDEYLI